MCYEKELAYAIFTDESGKETTFGITYAVHELPAKRGVGETASYAITASAKTKSNSGYANNDYVNISIYMTMYWTDGLGNANTIDDLTGGYDLIRGNVTTSIIAWRHRKRP